MNAEKGPRASSGRLWNVGAVFFVVVVVNAFASLLARADYISPLRRIAFKPWTVCCVSWDDEMRPLLQM